MLSSIDVQRRHCILKNQGSILPIDVNKVKSIAVIGPNSNVQELVAVEVRWCSINPISPLRHSRIKWKHYKINFAQGSMIDGDSIPLNHSLFEDSEGRQMG
jgi:hypothetical protein